jgi:hypothetical protein
MSRCPRPWPRQYETDIATILGGHNVSKTALAFTLHRAREAVVKIAPTCHPLRAAHSNATGLVRKTSAARIEA